MSIRLLLDQIVLASPGDQRPTLSPSEGVDYLMALDGHSQWRLSPQLIEFYRYASAWHHKVVQLEWIAPRDMPEVVSEPAVSDMIVADIDQGLIDDGSLGRENAVLFAIDHATSPFERAYFVFGDVREPRVIAAGSEVFAYQTLADYLRFWLEVIQA